MGNTCKPMDVSFQCMTKSTTNKKYINKNLKKEILKKKKKKRAVRDKRWLQGSLLKASRWGAILGKKMRPLLCSSTSQNCIQFPLGQRQELS